MGPWAAAAGSSGGTLPGRPHQPFGHPQNAIEIFCDHSDACVALSTFVKGLLKESKTLKSRAHISDRRIENNAPCSVEGYLFKLQSQTFCCTVQTLPLSEKIHLYVMVQFYYWVLT